MWSTRAVCLLGVAWLVSGCTANCPAGLARMQGVRLYFGGSVSAPAWAGFAADTLTPAFPDGFTVYEAGGQWRAPGSRQAVREDTRVVEVFGRAPLAAARQVAAAYRRRYNQMTVGIVSVAACGAFE